MNDTFKYFLILYNLGKYINYSSFRFSIEKDYCLEEKKTIIKEINKILLPPRKLEAKILKNEVHKILLQKSRRKGVGNATKANET